MFIYLPLILLFSTFHHIEGTCKSFDNYYILGELKKTPTTDAVCDTNDVCTYVSMDIPTLAIGSLSGCSGDVHMRLVVGVLSHRRDLHDRVKSFMEKNNMSLTFSNFSRLSNYGDQLHTFKTISGDAKFYLHFSRQGEAVNGIAVDYKPPTSINKPVKCLTSLGYKECFEGYCGMFELSSVSKDGKSQVSKKVEDCPNKIFDEIYMISQSMTSTDFNQPLLDDMQNMGTICANKSTHTRLSKNGMSSFYWHVNCYVPDDYTVPHIPVIYFHTPHNYYSFTVYKDGK